MKPWFAVLLVTLLPLPVAAAGPSHIESKYTDVDFEQCTVISSDEVGGTLVCPGYKGYPVVVSEGDLRTTVSYGVQPLEEKAIGQGFSPFNHIGKKIEWRIESDDDTFAPRATIVRWYLSGEDGADKHQILVVTQLKHGATCHIAYIDALATPSPNELARKIADEKAGSFDCANEPARVEPFAAF